MRARASELLPLAQRELGVKEVPAGSNTVKYNTAYFTAGRSGPTAAL